MRFIFLLFSLILIRPGSLKAQLFNVSREKIPESKTCTPEQISKVMKTHYKDYGEAAIQRNEKWYVNKPKDYMLKVFYGGTYKKGMMPNEQVYLGPKLYGRIPNGVQDKYAALYYNGYENKMGGVLMYFSNMYVFDKFWLDTGKHHIVPLKWEASNYVSIKFLGTEQNTYDEWIAKEREACRDPYDPIMYNIYRLWFLPYEDYYRANEDIRKLAEAEVKNYSMQSLSDAAYYDFYYGPQGKSSIRYSEEVIERNALAWNTDSLDLFIEHFPYSKHFLPFLTRFVESKNDLAGIANVLVKYPKVPYDKQRMEAKLLGLCNSMYDISVLKKIPGFDQLKQIENKAYNIAKSSKSIPVYQQLVTLYPNKLYNDELQKLIVSESKRIEDERLAHLKAEGPGSIWYIKSVTTSLDGLNIVSEWNFVYLDKSESVVNTSLSSSISNFLFKGKSQNSADEIDGYFINKENKFLYSAARQAATALYKIEHGIDSYPVEGLIGVYNLKIEDKSSTNMGFQLSKEDEKYISVFNSGGNDYGGSIHIIDDGQVEKENYNSMVMDKNGKVLFQTNDPFDDNGIGAPSFRTYDLPVSVSIMFRKKSSNELNLATIIISKPSNFDIRIK